jgi:hypothetical protein
MAMKRIPVDGENAELRKQKASLLRPDLFMAYERWRNFQSYL